MATRGISRSFKSRVFFYCLFVMIFFSIIYLYWVNVLERRNISDKAKNSCISELSSLKYELDVITGSKMHFEKLVADCQNLHTQANDKIKEISGSCMTMKQQSSLCQNQFDDLQNECKKVRENYNKKTSEFDLLKQKLDEAIIMKNETQKTVDKLLREIDDLKKTQEKENRMLTTKQNNINSFMDQHRTAAIDTNREFNKQVEISPGQYNIILHAKSPSAEAKKTNMTPALYNTNWNKVPPGFAPVLPVDDNSANVKSPNIPHVKENFLPNKTEKKVDKNRNNDKDLEIDYSQQKIQAANQVEDVLANNKPAIEDTLNNGNDDGQHGQQEDDDEGEEYRGGN